MPAESASSSFAVGTRPSVTVLSEEALWRALSRSLAQFGVVDGRGAGVSVDGHVVGGSDAAAQVQFDDLFNSSGMEWLDGMYHHACLKSPA